MACAVWPESWPLDPPTIARLGAAIVRVRPLDRPARIIVGRDTRESGEWIERELARGAASAGRRRHVGRRHARRRASRISPARSTSISASCSRRRTIRTATTASRCSPAAARSSAKREERAVEAVMADAGVGRRRPRATPHVDARRSSSTPYLEHVRAAAARSPARCAARGSRSTWPTARRRRRRGALFERLGFDVVTIGDAPDGRNINLGVRIDASGAAGRDGRGASSCRLGVAFDGDGDRAIFVDHRGHVVDGDAVLLMLAPALSSSRAGCRATRSSRR